MARVRQRRTGGPVLVASDGKSLNAAAGLGLLVCGRLGAVVGDALLPLERLQLVVGQVDATAGLGVGELVADALLDLAPRLVGRVGPAAPDIAHLELGRD